MSQFHARQQWGTPSISAAGKQKQADFCEFKASQGYRLSSRTAKTTHRNCVTENKQTKSSCQKPIIIIELTKL